MGGGDITDAVAERMGVPHEQAEAVKQQTGLAVNAGMADAHPAQRAIEREDAATSEVAKREHVVLCGFGRVGQNIARVLESQGFEYIAVDLDPKRVRPARQAGDAARPLPLE